MIFTCHVCNLKVDERGHPKEIRVRDYGRIYLCSQHCEDMYDNKVLTCVAKPETVDHPPHYGGADNPYEAIKVIEAWDLDFCLGNAIKYIARAGKKGDAVEDLRKAAWYLDRAIGHAAFGLPNDNLNAQKART